MARLAFDAAAGAFWLRDKNFFEIGEKIGMLGICLTADRKRVLMDRPNIKRDGRSEALRFISHLDRHSDFSGPDAEEPSQTDYEVVQEFLDKALDEFDVRVLPLG